MTKRLHVHLSVADLAQSVRYYERLLGAAPSVRKPDYAKWLLDEPPVNLALSARGRTPGIDHLGIQVDDQAAVTGTAERLRALDGAVKEQAAAGCCYAVSDKTWSTDPQGVTWEIFHTTGAIATYGVDKRPGEGPPASDAGCC